MKTLTLVFICICLVIPCSGIDDPIGYWKLDETSGAVAYDSVGDNDGTLIGDPVWTDGQVDGSLEFDGAGDYIDLGNDSILNSHSNFTISAWVKVNNSNQRVVVYSEGNRTTVMPGIVFQVLELGSLYSNKLYFLVRDDAGNAAGVHWDTPFPSGWHHVVAVRQGSEVRLYLDTEVKSASGAFAGTITIDDVAIGKLRVTDYNFDSNGRIDDVRLYDRALGDDEVLELYQASARGPVAHWKFDETSGTTAYDSAGSNDGTLYGNLTWTAGKIGGALDFGGGNDYVLTPADIIDTGDSFSIFAWVMLENKYGSDTQIIIRQDPGRGLMTRYARSGDTDKLASYLGQENSFSEQEIFQNINEWHHVGITHDGNIITFYIDGQEDGSNSVAAEHVTSSFKIGANLNPSSSYASWNGLIDDMRIYDRVLSEAEIRGLAGLAAGWSEPVLIDELNSTSHNSGRPCLSRDGLTMYFVRDYRLWEAYRDTSNGTFTSERQISELYTGQPLFYLWVNSDQLRLYYSRNVNSTTKAVLSQASRASTTDPWVEQIAFWDIHSTGAYDGHPTLIEDELTMFFSRVGGIYMATRASINEQFSNRTHLSEFDVFDAASMPCVLPDGLTMYFNARSNPTDTSDIYKATCSAINEPFGNFQRLGFSSDIFEEHGPYATPDERAVYYYGDRGAEGSGIWVSYRLDEPVIEVAVDIKPGSCPNPVNVKSKGVLPVAILGSEEFDVSAIDPASIFLNGVPAIRSSYEDVGRPVADPNECECTTDGPDGFGDLTLKFYTQQIVETFGEVNTGDILTLPLMGVLNDKTSIEGADCVVIVGRHKPINKADINEDGVVNTVDIAIVAENWLQ